MLTSELKSIFSQHSPPRSSSSFHIPLPHIGPNYFFLRYDITLPGNCLFSLCFHHFSDAKEWTTPSDLPTIMWGDYSACGWIFTEHLFITDQKLREKIAVTVFIEQLAGIRHPDVVKHTRLKPPSGRHQNRSRRSHKYKFVL